MATTEFVIGLPELTYPYGYTFEYRPPEIGEFFLYVTRNMDWLVILCERKMDSAFFIVREEKEPCLRIVKATDPKET